LLGEVRLDQARDWLTRYFELPGTMALALARAARAYQLGLWIADDDPDVAWLRMISALEVAAAAWARKSRRPYFDRLNEAWPVLGEQLAPVEEERREAIAKILAGQVRVKTKAVQFIENFAPRPPERRPRYGQLDWERLGEHVGAVYDRRSELLHSAIPLPLPMTMPPDQDDQGIFCEGQVALSTSSHDANWPPAAAPMPLWTFAYVVGGALRNWWRTTARS
jgi:hypothetical protein